MIPRILFSGRVHPAAAGARIGFAVICFGTILLFGGSAAAQEPQAPQPPAPAQPPDAAPGTDAAAQQPARAPSAATPAAESQDAESSPETPQPGGITEEAVKQMLLGKPLYLRGGFLDNSLSFNENGGIIGHSPQGSYTLSAIQIDKVHLTKHRVELEGARYGLHFLGALPYEDPTKALDRVKITPKKKVVKITIDRELVITPKKKKEKRNKNQQVAKNAAAGQATPGAPPNPQSANATQPTTPAGDLPTPPAASEPKELSDADQAKAELAAAPEAEQPADPGSVTTTTSPAHAAKLLKNALDKIFATGLDDRMMAAMPDFWKLYYQAVAAKADYRPKDPAVLRQNTVDKKAVLISKFEPPSNEWAQANGIAGPALYHAVVGADGKPAEIAVARPIGFGLDESAVDSIRKASFEPAMKDGKPVPVMLDLYVSFRIYSNRTAATGKPETEAEDKKADKQLPGPYSLKPVSQ